MAGYRRAGDEFVNATIFNTQGDRQRSAASEGNSRREIGSKLSTLGVGRNDSDNVVFPRLDKNAIFQQAVDYFAEADVKVGSSSGENPDFDREFPTDSRDSLVMFNDLENQIDKPNKLGPNLVVPDVNNLSEETETQVGRSQDQLYRGYGSDKKYREGEDTIGTFFKKHYVYGEQTPEVSPKLGEAIPEGSN
tara:strand:- start:1535 stop:2110 length:576 start_codon:yes stop_codon:yes gene_type:complete